MEVYLYDLGLSNEFLEIKKNKQKKKDNLLKLKTSGVLSMKSEFKNYTNLYCWVLPAPVWELY